MKKALMIIDEQEFFYDWEGQKRTYGSTLTCPDVADTHLHEVARVSAAALAAGIPIMLVELPGEAGPTRAEITHGKRFSRYVKREHSQRNAFEGGDYYPANGLKRRCSLADVLATDVPVEFTVTGLWAGDCVRATVRSLVKLSNSSAVTTPELLLNGARGRRESVEMFYRDTTDYLVTVDEVIERMLR